MNWRNTAVLGQFVTSRYEIGLSSEFPINHVTEIAVKIRFNIGNSGPNSLTIRVGEVSGYRSELLCTEDLDEVYTKKKSEHSRGRKAKGKKEDPSEKQGQKKSGKCGLHHTKPEHWLARVRKCSKCQRVGHFAAVC